MNRQIEQAAQQYAVRFIGSTERYIRRSAFANGAQYALSHQWVSVEDALPEDNQQVIASFLNGGISLGYYDYSDCLWFIDGLGAYDKYEISHWMSIPTPQLNPEKEEK